MKRLLPLLFLMSAPAHAAFLHLCPADAAPKSSVSAGASGPNGELRFVVNETPSLPGCRSLDLKGAQVETLHVLGRSARPATTILLQGAEKDGRFAVSEQTLLPDAASGRTPAPEPVALRANLLAEMRARSYGVEERVQAQLENGRLQVVCRAGSRPAGVLLSGPWYLPRARASLRASFSGTGTFSWQVADAAQAARESALDMGAIHAAGKASASLPLPERLDRGSWRHFVLACPAGAATLSLDALTLEPEVQKQTAPRATWVWDRSEWRERGDALLDWAVGEQLGELFIVVTLEDGKVKEPQLLSAFVRRARERGIAVSAVEGDPHMALPGHRAATVARARAYADYNAAAEPAGRLAGVQFDIEPYLLPEHLLPAASLNAEYLATAAALRDAAGPLALEFVVPFWWNDNREVLDGLARSADALSVMDYRTDPAQIVEFAVPFLDWAAANGKRVRIALEAGALPAETQRRYRRAGSGEAGDMLLLSFEGQQVLALLRQPMLLPGAQAYKLTGSRHIDGSATTFRKNKDALRALLPRLEADFGAWPGFHGIALHEWR